MIHNGKDGITITSQDIRDALAFYVADQDMTIPEALDAVRDDARRCGVDVSDGCGFGLGVRLNAPAPSAYMIDLRQAYLARPWAGC